MYGLKVPALIFRHKSRYSSLSGKIFPKNFKQWRKWIGWPRRRMMLSQVGGKPLELAVGIILVFLGVVHVVYGEKMRVGVLKRMGADSIRRSITEKRPQMGSPCTERK